MFTLSTTSTTLASSQIARRQRSSPPAARTARLVVYMSTTAILSACASFTPEGDLRLLRSDFRQRGVQHVGDAM